MEILFIAIVVIIAIMLVFNRKKQKSKKSAQLIKQEIEDFVANIEKNKSLSTISTNIILKTKESAFYSSYTSLYETRAVRHYTAGHTGLRVAKGVYIGGTKGRSVSSDEWHQIDTGQLIVTNKRIVFDGEKTNRVIPLNKVISINSGADNIEVSAENRQKSLVFNASNPVILATIIQICSVADNPSDLSNEKLKIGLSNNGLEISYNK